MREFKFEVNDQVSFDQGPGQWDVRGEGKITFQQEYLRGNYYLIEMPDGFKVQVSEEHITKNI